MKCIDHANRLRAAFIGYSPRVRLDSTDDGEECAELVIPASADGEIEVSVMLNPQGDGQSVTGDVWLGGEDVAKSVPEEELSDAIRSVLEDKVVAVRSYRNEKRYESKQPFSVRLFLMDSEEDTNEFRRLEEKLHSPATLAEKIFTARRAIYEISKRSGSEVIRR